LSIQKNKKGLWRFDRTVGGVRLLSRFLYVSRAEAEQAERHAVQDFVATGWTPQSRIAAAAAKAARIAARLKASRP
jgi:hypothetical protein